MNIGRHENNLHERDFYMWAKTQAKLLNKCLFEKVDLENVIEEIKDLGIAQRNALESQMIRLLMHLLKIKFQPQKHTKSWDRSVLDARIKIDRIVKKNPSLKRELESVMKESFTYSRKEAAFETGIDIKKFPKECPWKLEEVMK